MCSGSVRCYTASRISLWGWPRCWRKPVWRRRFVRRGKSGRLRERIAAVEPDLDGEVLVLEGVDFAEIEHHAAEQRLDLAVGNSKGYGLSRNLRLPLVRVGFPIHDRVDGPRLLHVGYRGAQQLFDRIVNAVIAAAQDTSPVGYSYM